MWHTIFIVSHAATGLISLVTGVMAMRNGRLFDVYLATLVGMTVFLTLAIAAEWAVLDTASRVLFVAFAGLAVVLVGLALRARRNRPTGTPSARYLDDVGFTVVALFDAFCVIAVLDSGAPIWAVVGTGVVIAVAGHFVLRWAKITLGGVGHVPESV
jgi:hypothetical protein